MGGNQKEEKQRGQIQSADRDEHDAGGWDWVVWAGGWGYLCLTSPEFL